MVAFLDTLKMLTGKKKRRCSGKKKEWLWCRSFKKGGRGGKKEPGFLGGGLEEKNFQKRGTSRGRVNWLERTPQ